MNIKLFWRRNGRKKNKVVFCSKNYMHVTFGENQEIDFLLRLLCVLKHVFKYLCSDLAST